MKNIGNLLIAFLVMGLFLTTVVPQTTVAEENQTTVYKQVGANQTNGSQYMQGVVNRIQIILRIIAYGAIGVFWVIIGLEYHFANQQKREELKEKIMYAVVGTLIVIAAVEGVIWMLGRWIAGV